MSGWREMKGCVARGFLVARGLPVRRFAARGLPGRGLAVRANAARACMARCCLVAALIVVLLAGPGAACGPAFLAPAAPAGSSGVQWDLGGELAGTVVYQSADGFSQVLGVLSGRLSLRLDPMRSVTDAGSAVGNSLGYSFGSGAGAGFSPAPVWWAAATVEPRLPVDLRGGLAPEGSLAVTEAYAGFRFPAADVYAGRFALPMETARLVVPYTLTPLDDAGRRPGADGLRADVYQGSGRWQLAAVRDGDRWTPVVGGRQAFSGWEAAGYVIGREHGVDAGIGASGLVGSTVVYGEAWSVAGEEGLRGSVGATGYVGDAVWTAELARTGFPTGLSPAPASPAVPLAALQLAYAPAFGWTVTAGAAIALQDLPLSHTPPGGAGGESQRAYQVGVTVTHDLVPGTAELELTVGRSVLPLQPAAGAAATIGVRWFF